MVVYLVPQEKTSLKLVLKVGGAPSTPEVMIDSLTDDNYSDTDRKQRHKKKKRHHDKHSSHRHHDRKVFVSAADLVQHLFTIEVLGLFCCAFPITQEIPYNEHHYNMNLDILKSSVWIPSIVQLL